jgi:hypothetical protein
MGVAVFSHGLLSDLARNVSSSLCLAFLHVCKSAFADVPYCQLFPVLEIPKREL